jgi:hypothetical protein
MWKVFIVIGLLISCVIDNKWLNVLSLTSVFVILMSNINKKR